MENKREKRSLSARMTSFTVKQLSELFGKSEDTIRRWKNEGIGKGEDNIRLSAMENEDSQGRRTSRHLVFTRSAVRDFVQANPFLMDDAPQLREFMETPAKNPEVFALPDSIETSRRRVAWQDEEADDGFEMDNDGDFEPDDDEFLRRFTKCVEDEMDSDDDAENGSFFDRLRRRMKAEDNSEEDPLLRFTRCYKSGTWDEDEEGNPFISREYEGEEEEQPPADEVPPRGHEGRRNRRRPNPDEDSEAERERRRRRHYDGVTISYMLGLLSEREASCRREQASAMNARTIMLRRPDIADALPDGGSYIDDLIRQREEQLSEELENIAETMRALERMRW